MHLLHACLAALLGLYVAYLTWLLSGLYPLPGVTPLVTASLTMGLVYLLGGPFVRLCQWLTEPYLKKLPFTAQVDILLAHLR